MQLCVLGLGYVGLPTATVFASHGFDVVGVDIDASVLASLVPGAGRPCTEPGLGRLLEVVIRGGQLRASSLPLPSDVFLLCVPTPLAADKKADLSAVEAAAASLVSVLRPGNLVVVESTCPVGTTTGLVASILERSSLRAGRDFDLAFCAERVIPGNVLEEFTHNARVIGGLTAASGERAAALYRQVVKGDIRLTDCRTAEMVKLVENTYRDVAIALSNEIARLCESGGVDAWHAIELANLHPRVHVPQPGPGVGGHCIPVDPWFLLDAAASPNSLIATARALNDRVPALLASRIDELLGGLPARKLCLLGVAYKAEVSDVRSSPAWALAEHLRAGGAHVTCFDPLVAPQFACSADLTSAIAGTHMLVVVTDHHVVRQLCAVEVARSMAERRVLDTRGCLDRGVWEEAGFEFHRLGDGTRRRLDSARQPSL